MTTVIARFKTLSAVGQTPMFWSPVGTSLRTLPGVVCSAARLENSGYQIFPK